MRALMVAALLAAASAAHASKLGDFEKQATKKKDANVKLENDAGSDVVKGVIDALFTPSDSSSSSSSGSSCDHDCGNPAYLFTVPAWPWMLANSLPHHNFRDYPYEETPAAAPEGERTASQRVEVSYQRVDGSIGGLGARYRLLTKSRIGFDGSWTRYRERYNPVDLNLFNADLTGTLYQSDGGIFWFGAGVAGLSGHRTNAGPDGRAGFEWHLFQPLSLEGSAAATVLNGTGLYDFRGGVGLHARRVELELGYRALRGGTSHLDGPEASVALWF